MKTIFNSSFIVHRSSLVLLLLSAFLCFSVSAFCQPQQSENFRITKSVLDAGGGASTSTNFSLVSAFGQPTPIGQQSSANFVLHAGFLSPAFSVSPLSPIQELVIQYNSPNIRLDWERIPDAVTYTIYRDTTALFTPGPLNQIGTTTDTFYVDLNALALPYGRYYYNVTSARASFAPPTAIALPPFTPFAQSQETKQVPAAKGSKQK
jgi:hypothetical protein